LTLNKHVAEILPKDRPSLNSGHCMAQSFRAPA